MIFWLNVIGFNLFAFVVLCIFAFRNFATCAKFELRNFEVQIYTTLQMQINWNLSHSIKKLSEIVAVFVSILKSMFEFSWLSVCHSINWKGLLWLNVQTTTSNLQICGSRAHITHDWPSFKCVGENQLMKNLEKYKFAFLKVWGSYLHVQLQYFIWH